MRYMGSKQRISRFIVPIIQKYICDSGVDTYVEPFGGGCNVIDKIVCKYKYAYDVNKYLIALLQRVQAGLPLYDEVPRELYEKARTDFNTQGGAFSDWQLGCIGFLRSFGGRFFDGGFGQNKNDRDYYQEGKRNILKQAESELFKDIHLAVSDYRDLDFSGVVMYCDPPYANTQRYKKMGRFNHDEFWEYMRQYSKKNIVLISEQSAPDDFECIWKKETERCIGEEHKIATEKLFIKKN